MISLPLGVQQGCLCCCGCIEGQGARQVAVLKTAIHPLVFCTLWGLYTRVFVVESHSHTSCGLGMRLNYISCLHTCTSVQFCILTVSTSKERQKVCSCNFFLFQILNELWFLHLMRHDLDSPSSCMLICIHSSFVHWSPSWVVFLCFSQSVVLLSLLPRPIRIGLGYKARYCCDIPHLATNACVYVWYIKLTLVLLLYTQDPEFELELHVDSQFEGRNLPQLSSFIESQV